MFRRPVQSLDLPVIQPKGLFQDFDLDLELGEQVDDRNNSELFNDPFGLNRQPEHVIPDFELIGEQSDVEDEDLDTNTTPFDALEGDNDDNISKHSWDSFYKVDGSLTRFLSEQPRNVIDSTVKLPGKVVPQQRLVSCLYHLALGRQSLMFYFSSKRMAFVPVSINTKYRINACSTGSLQALVDSCLTCGSQLRRLKYTVMTIYNQDKPNPVLVAFADCINLIIKAIQSFVSPTSNVLQLYESIQTPSRIVGLLTKLVGCHDITKSVRLNRLPQPHKLIDALYERALVYENSDDSLFMLTRLILTRTTRPYLDDVAAMVGLGSSQHFEPHLFIVSPEDTGQAMDVDWDSTPMFLKNHAEQIAQTLTCFRMLTKYGDSWTNLKIYHLEKVQLSWCFDVDSALKKRKQAQEYEARANNLTVANRDCSSPKDGHEEQESQSVHDLVEDLLGQMDGMGLDPSDNENRNDNGNGNGSSSNSNSGNYPGSDELELLCEEIFRGQRQVQQMQHGQNHQGQRVPMDIVPAESFSGLFRAQYQLGNKLVMQLFTNNDEYDIRWHSKLLREVFLLGDGILCVGLEDAIFTNLVRQWPPSAAQLNHEVSEIVEDTVQRLGGLTRAGIMNFGLGAERPLQRFDATDMLRMCYNVPQPLRVILTPSVLKRYDMIFRRLLQHMRLIQHVKNRAKDGQEGQEAQHFVWVMGNHYQTSIRQHFNTDSNSNNLNECIEKHATIVRRILRDFYITDRKVTSMIDEISQAILDNEPNIPIQQLVETLPKSSSLYQLLNYNCYYQ